MRKYIHGPCVDEPVCMIDVADSNALYYYHFDALGSVVALSDSDGDSVQTYEYSVYGQVAAEDPNFLANPYMFTGRRFDFETGLYYYRARYYNPYIGRFLQIDPVGHGAGMNLYAYCGNSPLAFVDPSGLWASIKFVWRDKYPQHVQALCYNSDGSLGTDFYFNNWDDLLDYMWEFPDFCDVDVSGIIPTLSFSEAVPQYIKVRNMYRALGATPLSGVEYDKIRTQVIIENVEQSAWRYISGFNAGEFDFAYYETHGRFILSDGTVLNSGAEFGNYLAGYAGYYHFGPNGALAAAAGGHPYVLAHNAFMAILKVADGRSFLDALNNPDLGTWFDPERDQDWINRGIQDAYGKKGGFWGAIIWPPFGPKL